MLFFALLPTILALATMEAGVRLWFISQGLRVHQPLAVWQLAHGLASRPSIGGKTVSFAPLAQFDPLLGYSCRPGVHEVLIDRGNGQLRFQATIGQDGFRVTSTSKPDQPDLQHLWLMGCSYTWGLGVSDEATFAWLLQDRFPEVRVENLSCNGYGTTQAYLLLKAAHEHLRPQPAVAVVVYNSFHLERNIASVNYIQSLSAAGEAFGRSNAFFPQARLEHGTVRTVPIALFQPLDVAALASPASAEETTIALLREMKRLANDMNTRLVVAFQSGPSDDPVVAFARQEQLPVADIRINLDADGGALYRNFPYDLHPNVKAHQLYASALHTELQNVIETLGASSTDIHP